MKLITFGSFKGGSGKTTALMAAASSLIAQGHKIALLEADQNAPLTEWRKNGLARGTWDDNCQILPADQIATFETSYEKAEKDGVQYVLADTQGSASDLNDAIFVNSNILVVPTALTSLDITAALDTMDYAINLFMASKDDVPTAILIQRLPVGKLTIAQSAELAQLQSLPMFETQFHSRDAFASLASRGLLHKYCEVLDNDPSKRIAARHLAVAKEEADSFVRDLLDELNRSEENADQESIGQLG